MPTRPFTARELHDCELFAELAANLSDSSSGDEELIDDLIMACCAPLAKVRKQDIGPERLSIARLQREAARGGFNEDVQSSNVYSNYRFRLEDLPRVVAVYFAKDKWAKMSHNEFRKRLAWAFLTLGKEEYLDDVLASSVSSTSVDAWQSSGVNSASNLFMGPHEHRLETFNRDKLEHHTCGYCGCRTTKYCVTCKEDGHGVIAVCGRRSGRNCIDRHQMGEEIKHGSWRLQKLHAEARMATVEDEDAPVVPPDSVTSARNPRRQRQQA
ncbi:hypothetical protein AB1Y20_020841 [Prymnesium parvum]|uniref:Uncharacterized protein n=1 Tax=Prymnesium parvum TaxID=97485 RepID=A0AB34JVU5_PRYPA